MKLGSTTVAQRFLFDRRFDSAAKLEAEASPEPPPPVFSLDDLEQARAEGAAQGRAAALAEANAQIQAERCRDQTLLAIAEHLSALHGELKAAADRAGRDAVRVAETLVRKLLPDLYARHGSAEIEALVTTTLAQLPSDHSIGIRVAPSLLAELAPLLQLRAEERGLAEPLRVSADAAIAVGDCAIDWAGGGLLRDHASLWRDVTALIDETAGPRATPEAAETGGQHV